MTPGMPPLSPELLAQLSTLGPIQLAWLSGYCWSQSQQPQHDTARPAAPATLTTAAAPITTVAGVPRITILSASQTGNACRVAEQLQNNLNKVGLSAQLIRAGDYKSKTLATEDILLLVSSTQGEGEPPEEALPLYKFLFGKKAPQLQTLRFAVLGLGDSSYPEFCRAGRDFDTRLSDLGAQRLIDHGECDLDFQATATAWIDAITARLQALNRTPSEQPAAMPAGHPSPSLPSGQTLPAGPSAQAVPIISASATDLAVLTAPPRIWTREQPFTASLSLRQKITSRQAEKDVQHIEIDLSDSGIQYQPGDALGVWPVNAPGLVSEILTLHQLSGEERVQLHDGLSTDIRQALTHHLDITRNTPAFLQAYAALSGNGALQTILDNAAKEPSPGNTPPIGIFAQYPTPLTAQQLVSLFRPQTPRLYSIASAQEEVGDEVHLTVGVVQFQHHGQHYTGSASGYLGHLLEEGDGVRVFVAPNPHFRLPDDGDTSLIMIGAGTGIAPYRAFMQQREARGDSGKNWLFFGNQRFIDDFLYQTEWLQYRQSGLLTRADLAWSRQGPTKIYVQHRLLEAGADIWRWLQDGASLYVCGDASRMAQDVERALLDIACSHGGLNMDDAEEYLNELREERRYQRDVY